MARSRHSSLLDPNASTLNLSPFSKASSKGNASLASDQRGGTGSTAKARVPSRGLFPTRLAVDHDLTDDVSMEDEETLVDRLRLARNDSMQQHLYSTAEFWGNKVFELTRDPNDGFWLAQIHFLTLQFARAEHILMQPKPDLAPAEPLTAAATSQANFNEISASASRTKGKGKATDEGAQSDLNGVKLVRLTDISVACRYLAAQCMIRQQKWSEALDLLGTTNPFASKNGPTERAQDGGIKFEASLCHLRGLIHLHHNSAQKAKEAFLEALTLDVKCFESFESLVDGNLMTIDEEWEFVQGLRYQEQLSHEDADFVKMAYTVRLKKYKHHDEFVACRERLIKQYGLSQDPDVLYGLAEELFLALKWQECYSVTSSILTHHPGHGPTMPLHLGCMYHLAPLHSRLFLFAHELVQRSPETPVSWYAVGLWYFTQKRWDEARRFFGKAVLLDSRFGPAWIAFAHAYALESEHDQAITAYSTAQRHFQGSHLPLLFMGMQHVQLNNHKLGFEYLHTAWEMCTIDPLLTNELGVTHYWLGDYEKAVDYLENTLALVAKGQASESAWYSTYVNLGHAYRKLQKWKEATAAFEKALDLDPAPSGAHLGLGYILTATGQREEAIERLHEALIRAPGDPIAAEVMGVCLETRVHSLRAAATIDSSFHFPGLDGKAGTQLDAEVLEAESRYLQDLEARAWEPSVDDSSMQIEHTTQGEGSFDMDQSEG